MPQRHRWCLVTLPDRMFLCAWAWLRNAPVASIRLQSLPIQRCRSRSPVLPSRRTSMALVQVTATATWCNGATEKTVSKPSRRPPHRMLGLDARRKR